MGRGLRKGWFSLPLNQVYIAVALAGEADHVTDRELDWPRGGVDR